MARKLGVLIHGAGWVSTQHIDAFGRHGRAEVVAISSRTVEGARLRAEEAELDIPCFDDLGEALARPGIDIVSICTPQHLHAEDTIAAARAGKHIVIEKPVAMDLRELRAMEREVARAGVKTVVSFVLRWNPLFREIKRRLARGEVGRVYCVETDYQSYLGNWWKGFRDGRTRERGGSALLVGGCHAIDALRWFAAPSEEEAADPLEVFSWSGGLRGDSRRQYDPTTASWRDGEPLEYPGLELALVRFANGVLGKVGVNFDCVQPYTFPVRIFGERGTVRDRRLWAPARPEHAGWEELEGVAPDSADVTHHPFQAQMDHFIDCIERDLESHCNLADAAKTHEVVFAARRSQETGRPVALPLCVEEEEAPR